MDEQYKIQLGVDIDLSDIQTEIDTKSKAAKPKLKVDVDADDLVKKLQRELGEAFGNSKNLLKLDTSGIEKSLGDVKGIISDIKDSLGTIDSKSGMKSLLSSVNQIAKALDKASDKFEKLNANLNALSGKDLSLNFGINLGGSNPTARNAAYRSKVESDTLPQLQKQRQALENYFKEYYKAVDGVNGIAKLAVGQSGDVFEELFGKNNIFTRMSDHSNMSAQMSAYKRYFSLIKEMAQTKGIDISHITSGFSQSADQLVKDAQDIQTGAKEMENSFEKLKQIFGGSGIDADNLTQQLDDIVRNLTEIKKALTDLSSGVSVEGLTQSFDKLSDTIEKLVQNATQVKSVFGDGISNAGMSNQTKAAQETVNAYQEVAREAKKLDNISIDISNGNIE